MPLGFLQVEAGSVAERLYGKLGFQPVFARVGYRKAAWPAAGRLEESAVSQALGFAGRISGGGGTRRRERFLVATATGARLRRVCEEEKIPAESAICGLWALLMSRCLRSEEVAVRVRYKGRNSGAFRWAIENDKSAAAWLREMGSPVPEGGEIETGVCFDPAPEDGPEFLTLLNPEGVFGPFEISYCPELFSPEAIRRMGNHLLALFDSLATNPASPLRELEILPQSEKRQLLDEWSSGGEIDWDGKTVWEMIERQAKRTPAAVALALGQSEESGETRRLSFAELIAASAGLAAALRRSGVRAGSPVGVLLPRSLEVVISMLGIWRAGGVFVPIDPGCPRERVGFMAWDARMKVVITSRALAGLVPEGVPTLMAEELDGVEDSSSVRVEPHDPAYVIYTSGSTGQPKGVTITQGAIAQHVTAMIEHYRITPEDRHLHFSPFTFDASFEQLLPPLAAGASVVVRDERLWDTGEFIRNLERFQLTMVDIPMAYWGQLAQHASAAVGVNIPARLRLVVAGGEAMPADRLAEWRRGPFGNRRLVNAYGPTEATVTATAFDAGQFTPMSGTGGGTPIGRPLPGRRTFILDDLLRPVPIRVAGQLHIGGPLLATGYVNRADLTRERFIPNPFGEGRLYATGDLARILEDGNIEFLGRLDDQVKIRGFRIEPGEIEAALKEHQTVGEAIVVARNDGAGQKRLLAYVTSRGGKAATERELRDWLRARLPEHMIPHGIVGLESMPLLPSGKVNRKALPEPGSESGSAPAGAIPKTPLELQLQLLFQRALRRAGVGVDESFFELGGDSLQALELIVQIEKATGKRLPLESLFLTPTVRSIAREIESAARGNDWSCLVPLQKAGARPPLFLVHTTPGDVLGYGNLIHHLGADQPCYGFQALGLKDGAEPQSTIERMAREYVALLREFQPRGPYLLGGWCFGGIVAVEMAQQLREAGQEVGGLLLMETISVSPGLANWAYQLARFRCLFQMSPRRWWQYLEAKAKYRRQVELDNRMRFRRAGGEVDPQEQRWLERLERVYNANMAALNVHRPRAYPGKVTLFNAVEQDPGILPDPNYGWTGLAQEIEIHEVAGNHDTMLAEPNVGSLAAAVRGVLARK